MNVNPVSAATQVMQMPTHEDLVAIAAAQQAVAAAARAERAVAAAALDRRGYGQGTPPVAANGSVDLYA